MQHRMLRILALAFVAMVIVQSLLGGAVFTTTVGWTPEAISSYYGQKSLHGLLETLLPHTLFIAVALMGSLHFLGFVSSISEQHKQYWIHLLFLLFVLDQSAPVLVNLGIDLFAYVKLIAFAGFEILLGFFYIHLFRHSVMRST